MLFQEKGAQMAKRKRRSDKTILNHVDTILADSGGEALEISADAVAVKGDARQYGPTVIVRFSDNVTSESRAALVTKITNQVPEITRVLVEYTPKDPL